MIVKFESSYSLCRILAAIKAAANKDLMLVPTEVAHLHVCIEAIWHVAGHHLLQPQVPAVGSHNYRQLKFIFNEVMLANERKIRIWILHTAKAVNRNTETCELVESQLNC